MNYPWTRHFQRYEYILNKEYTKSKIVVDVGAGYCSGAYALTSTAKRVFAVDPKIAEAVGKRITTHCNVDINKIVLISDSIYNFHHKVDVAVAVEVFEHMSNPAEFIEHLASICNNLFITTPLAQVTARTKNSEHIAEYSKEDFEAYVNAKFNIVERAYQTGDMRILNNTHPYGTSLDTGHVVQMLWCKCKEEW